MTPFVLDYVGYCGPLILSIFTIMMLRMRTKIILVYLLFLIINTVANLLLKLLIKEPRPTDRIVLTRFEQETDNTYGMPSGHAQSVAYTTAFLYLLSLSSNVMFVVGWIGMTTLYQRYKFRQHSLRQLLAGTLIGVLIALIGHVVCVNNRIRIHLWYQ